MRSRPLLYSAGLFLLGLAYRATFLSQGFNFLTDRPNPTRIDWYDPSEIIPRMTLEAVADLERHPASVVLFAYLTTHFTRVAQVDDFGVFQPLPQP